jgi:hypothetical protein
VVLVRGLGIAIKMKAKKADFDATIAVHPTAAEEPVHANAECVGGFFAGGASAPGPAFLRLH